jgi:hypothetical protein
VAMKNAVFWDVTSCGSRKNLCFGRQLLVTANVVPIALIRFALMMEAILSSETSVVRSHTASHPRRRFLWGIYFHAECADVSIVSMLSLSINKIGVGNTKPSLTNSCLESARTRLM